MLRRFERLQFGRLTLRENETAREFGDPGATLAVALEVRDPRFYPAIALGGHLGAAEAYLDGWWNTDNLTALVQLFVRNRSLADRLDGGWAALAGPVRKAWHALRRNTRRGSRRNITAHYDLGNDFFS